MDPRNTLHPEQNKQQQTCTGHIRVKQRKIKDKKELERTRREEATYKGPGEKDRLWAAPQPPSRGRPGIQPQAPRGIGPALGGWLGTRPRTVRGRGRGRCSLCCQLDHHFPFFPYKQPRKFTSLWSFRFSALSSSSIFSAFSAADL